VTKGSEYAFRVFPISNTFRTDTYFALLFVFVFDSPIPLPYLTPKSTPPTFSRVYVFATVNQHPPPPKKKLRFGLHGHGPVRVGARGSGHRGH